MNNLFPIQFLLFHLLTHSCESTLFYENLTLNLCNRSYEANVCMLPMKTNLSEQLQQSIIYAQSTQNKEESIFEIVKRRIKRGFVGIASKIKKIGSKLGGLDSLVGGAGGGGAGSGAGEEEVFFI